MYHCAIKNFHQIARKFILVNRHKLNRGGSFKASVRRANLALQTTIVVAFFGLCILILDLSLSNYSNVLVDFGVVATAISCFYLITKGHIKIAKSILVFAALAACTINSSKDGFNAGNQYLWFTTLVGIFALFSFKEKNLLIVCLLFLLATLIFCDVTHFSFLMQEPPTAAFVNTNHRVAMYLSLVVCLFFMVFIAKSINESFRDKDHANDIIKKQKEAIAEAHKQLDTFVYHASHDLRAPLTSMLGLIEVSKKESDLSKMHNLLYKQEETILKLDDYVKDILILSRLKTSAIQPSLLNLEEIVSGLLKQCHFMIEEKRMSIFSKIDKLENFYTDPKRLNIVLSNLISNSIKYTDSKKAENQLFIEAKIINNYLIIKLRDNGIGIAENKLEKVFEMFYYNEHQNKGTGLGLYIVKETLIKLGGSVKINSTLGEYTEVEILLPNLA